MKNKRPLLLFFILSMLAALVAPSCRPSADESLAEIEAQRQLWVAEYREESPDRTQDTVELKRRLDHFIGTGNKVGQLMMYRLLGNEARNSSQFRKAIENHTNALEAAYEIHDTINITIMMNDLATDFRRIGAFDEAAPYHYLALQIAEQYRGPDVILNERNMASAYNGIGSICREMGENDEAVRVYRLALELEMRHNNYRGLAINYANIGAVHFDRGEYAEAEENYVVSLENNEKAGLPMGIALCRINIGRIYEVQGRLDKALREFEQAYEVMAGSSDKWHWLDACFEMANIHIKKGNFDQAGRYLADGLRTAREINSLKHIKEAYNFYSVYYYDRGEYRRSVESVRAMQAYADTLARNLEMDRLLESRVKYETDKFARQIENLDEAARIQAARQRTAILMTLPFVLALIFLSIFLYARRKQSQQKAAELKELDRMRSNFFTNIAHEFRTPLAIINGYSDRLRRKFADGATPDPGDEEQLATISRSGGTLLNLVNELLEFSRSESGNTRLKWRRGDVVIFLRSVVEYYDKSAQGRSVALSVVSQTSELVMNYAPEAMKKVVGNLLSNAIRHTPPGGRIEMLLRPDESGKCCVITVRDNGEGISPENLPRIFELYYSSGSGGMGIGLALSKQLVEEMGGTIAVSSTPGQGTEFTITLPLSLADIPKDQLTTQSDDTGLSPVFDISEAGGTQPADGEGEEDGKPVILVVEDNRDMANYISTVLGDRYTIHHALNGVEGLAMAEAYVPDLIITDVMMPEKDGYAFTADIRASVAVSHVPVIMLTAKATDDDRIEGIRTGADAYLSKPFNEQELLVRIEQLMESRARLQEKYSTLITQIVETPRKEHDTDDNITFLNDLILAVGSHIDDTSWFPGGLANRMCLSESQLNRKVRAMTGHSVFSFLMRMRLDRAKQMLMKGSYSVSDVAAACGFSDAAHFSRSFKNEFEIPPSQFHKRS